MTVTPNDLGGHPVLSMDETYHETLKWINRIRRKHGKGGLKKIRKGYTGAENCPVANSLKDCWPNSLTSVAYADVIVYHKNDKKYTAKEQNTTREKIDLPKYVYDFIRDFENAKYPE